MLLFLEARSVVDVPVLAVLHAPGAELRPRERRRADRIDLLAAQAVVADRLVHLREDEREGADLVGLRALLRPRFLRR